MKVGILLDLGHSPSDGVAEDGLIAYARVADEVGFSTVWIPERHFTSGSPLPSPFSLGAAVAAETSSIRIGTFVKLTLHHPLAIAEDSAVLDLLSGGRLILAADPGATEDELRGYGVPFAGRRERFRENLDVVRKAWTHDGFAYAGRTHRIPLHTRALSGSPGFREEPCDAQFVLPWKRAGMPFDYLSVLPKPAQIPHPPVFIVGDDADAVAYAARTGRSLFLDASHVADALVDRANSYWDEIARSGRSAEEVVLALAAKVYVEADGDKARARCRPLSEGAIVGAPGEIFDAIRKLRQRTRMTHFICSVDLPGLTPDLIIAAIRLFSAEVAIRLEM